MAYIHILFSYYQVLHRLIFICSVECFPILNEFILFIWVMYKKYNCVKNVYMSSSWLFIMVVHLWKIKKKNYPYWWMFYFYFNFEVTNYGVFFLYSINYHFPCIFVDLKCVLFWYIWYPKVLLFNLIFLKSNMCITLVLEITYHSYLFKDMLKLEHFRYCTII